MAVQRCRPWTIQHRSRGIPHDVGMNATPASDRVRIHRNPKRASYDTRVIHDVLDAGMVCHLGYVVEAQPYVIPTLYGRDGDRLVLHGSAASRALITGSHLPVCVTVTHHDGLVLARSLFHHSANFRSVVVIGRARRIDDEHEKLEALRVLTEHLVPGRWDEARAPTGTELRATAVLELALDECSAKIRTGPPDDDEDDLVLGVWAGVIPLETRGGAPVPDPTLADGIPVAPSVRRWVPGPERHQRGGSVGPSTGR